MDYQLITSNATDLPADFTNQRTQYMFKQIAQQWAPVSIIKGHEASWDDLTRESLTAPNRYTYVAICTDVVMVPKKPKGWRWECSAQGASIDIAISMLYAELVRWMPTIRESLEHDMVPPTPIQDHIAWRFDVKAWLVDAITVPHTP